MEYLLYMHNTLNLSFVHIHLHTSSPLQHPLQHFLYPLLLSKKLNI